MSANDPLEILLAHNLWATEHLLNASKTLSDEQLDRPFEIGRGTLRATLIHIVDVIRGWDDSLNARPNPATFAPTASVAEMLALLPEIAANFAATCHTGTADDSLHATRGNRSITAPRGAVVTHILTHGMHHRAQALNMLRHLGVKPLPPSSVFEWMLGTGKAELKTN